MLPAAARLRAAADFAAVVRRGRRGVSPTLVVHLLDYERPGATRAGFVVSRKVGNSVVRHRVTRRLRPLVRDWLPDLPAGTDLVVRALPSAATSNSTELAGHLDVAIRAAARRAGVRLPSTGHGQRRAFDRSAAEAQFEVAGARAVVASPLVSGEHS